MFDETKFQPSERTIDNTRMPAIYVGWDYFQQLKNGGFLVAASLEINPVCLYCRGGDLPVGSRVAVLFDHSDRNIPVVATVHQAIKLDAWTWAVALVRKYPSDPSFVVTFADLPVGAKFKLSDSRGWPQDVPFVKQDKPATESEPLPFNAIRLEEERRGDASDEFWMHPQWRVSELSETDVKIELSWYDLLMNFEGAE